MTAPETNAALPSAETLAHQVEPGADVHVVQSAADWQPNHRWTVVNYDLLGKLQAQLARIIHRS